MRLTIAFLSGVLLIGCTDAVDPIVDSGRAYTVYGLLDAHADTQAVRVFSIDGTLDLIRPASLGAKVTSVEVGTAAEHSWQESVVEFSNGRFGHVYWAAFRAKYEGVYRLDLERPDGARTTVQITMPPRAEAIRMDPVLGFGYARLPVLWRHAPRVHDIRVAYTTNYGTYPFEYPLDQEVREDGVLVDIYLSRDFRDIFSELNRARIPVANLRLLEVTLSVLISSSAWVPPGGVYDPDVLIEPGVFSNVENGFGFVGAGYDTLLVFDPPDSVKTAAGIPVGMSCRQDPLLSGSGC